MPRGHFSGETEGDVSESSISKHIQDFRPFIWCGYISQCGVSVRSSAAETENTKVTLWNYISSLPEETGCFKGFVKLFKQAAYFLSNGFSPGLLLLLCQILLGKIKHGQ